MRRRFECMRLRHVVPAFVMLLIALCGGASPSVSAQSAGGGDPTRGAELYARLPCASCHDITKPWPGGDVCPNLGNIASEAARIVGTPEYRGKARDAAGYIRESIVAPNAYIVPGAHYRDEAGKSVMPEDLAKTLTPRDLDDLVAFLMTHR